MYALKELPPNYEQKRKLELKDNVKLYRKLNLWSLLTFVVLMVFMIIIYFLGGISFSFPEMIGPGIVLILGSIVYVLLHEYIHAVSFHQYTGARLRFGLSGSLAFTGCPGFYFSKRAYLWIGISPFVILTVLFLALATVVPFYYSLVCYLLFAFNASGSVGDFFVLALLMRCSDDVLIQDSGVTIEFYEKNESNR